MDATEIDSLIGGDEQICEKVKTWFHWDKHQPTIDELVDLVKSKNIKSLHKVLDNRMEFGTAGLRSRMGVGVSQMNDVTVIQATQGLITAASTYYAGSKLTENGVIVGYDGRHNSERFAQRVASAITSKGFPVHLFSRPVPTPFVAFGVRYYQCQCGIMVTASHNPKEDNGYKVFWDNGAQIISPVDKQIATAIEENLETWAASWLPVAGDGPIVVDPFEEIFKEYYKPLMKMMVFKDEVEKEALRFTYTAMHGVGTPFAREAFRLCGFKPFIEVKEQVEIDPEFPTVKFPNPEEGKSALDLAIKTADANGSRVILANDPDADRLAVAEKQKNGGWRIFTGNEIGCFLGHFMWERSRQNPILADNCYMLASTVSSKILETVAKAEGFHFVETLTGFKWMGNLAQELLKEGKTVLFAYEEAIGFMCGSSVLDKDGISAMVMVAELCSCLSMKKTTLSEHLNSLYIKYGHHLSYNSYWLCYETIVIKNIFDKIRVSYPKNIKGIEVKDVIDLTVGFDSRQSDKKPVLPVSSSSQMIIFIFGNGVTLTLRTSGTEPKIKYYSEMISNKDSVEGLEEELKSFVDGAVEMLLKPKENSLTPRS